MSLVRHISQRLPSGVSLLRGLHHFLDIFFIQADWPFVTVNPNTDQPVFADASHDGGEFDGVTGLYLHSEYLARAAQEARP